MSGHRNIILTLTLLLSLLSCGSKELHDGALTCGTEGSPYYLMDVGGADTALYRLDYWWWLENEGMYVDTNAILRDIEYLNKSFKSVRIQFELGTIYSEVNSRKFNGQKDYKKHGWMIEEWYWEKRDSVPYALFCMVYPPTWTERGLFPGAAMEIGGQGFCIQSLFLGTSTSVHEMGHVFGLYHPHQQDATDGRNYTTGDLIADLPYHPSLSGNVSQGGEIINLQKDLTEEEIISLVHNWESYTIYELRDSFSLDQSDRMWWVSVNYPKVYKARINM